MAIEWRESLATGHETIDSQHKELFKRFNNLLNACKEGRGQDEVCRLLSFLGDYVRSHFAAEEELQVRHNYGGYDTHKKEHERFIADLHKLADQIRQEGSSLSVVIETNQVMVNWLLKHISGTDRELASFLRSAN